MADIRGIEQQIQEAKEAVAKRNMARKLFNNPEFRKLVLEDFCLEDCARLATVAGDPNVSETERKLAAQASLAAGQLKRFFAVIELRGNTAEREIPEAEAYLDEARAEENN